VIRLNGIPAFVKQLQLEHAHGLGLLWSDGGGYALAVIDTNSGEVLAWDGWYFELSDNAPDYAAQDVRQLNYRDYEDMPGKLLHEANAPWLGGVLGWYLMPIYSVAQEAGRLVRSHAKSATDNPRTVSDARLCAYLPIVDEAAFIAALEDVR
jgi:hypothetical protein